MKATLADGKVLFDFLKDHQRIGYKLGPLTIAVGFGNSANARGRTRRALRVARTLAAAEGLMIPDAVPQLDFVYRCTNEGVDALEAAVQAHRRAQGTLVGAFRHDAFIAANPALLSEADQMDLVARTKFRTAMEAINDGMMESSKASLARQKEIRELKKQLRDQVGNGAS